MSIDLWNSLKALLPSAQTFIQTLLSNSIVIGAIAWLAKIWADRRIEVLKGAQTQNLEHLRGAQAQKIEEMKGSQSAQLESVKGDIQNLGRSLQADLERRMLVFKTHFDIEFQAYQEIWAKCDESADLAAMTLGLAQRQPIDNSAQEEERTESIRRYDACREALIEVRRKRPFVTKEIADLSKSIVVQCLDVTQKYKDVYQIMTFNDDYDRVWLIKELKDEIDKLKYDYDQLGDLIATRLASLYATNA